MSIKILFECDGCFGVVESDRVTREFESFSGKGHGFGRWSAPKVADYAPNGWFAFDPYTSCTYCPECWAEIQQAQTA